jgi:SulP family sulfate permease
MRLEKEHLKGDFFGGLTTGIVALPLALAFGVASGLEGGAQAGLYSAIFMGYVAAIFGGTKPQVSGPTGPMTVVAAGFVATVAEPRFLFVAVMLGGLIQIAFGLLKLGHYIRYVPRPVISGFMTGIGVIIVLIQIQPILGSPNEPGPVQALAGASEAIADLDVQALLLGLGTIALIYLIPRISKQIPAPLVALLVATVTSELMQLDVPKIGALPTALPKLALLVPSASAIPHVLLAGLTLAILGSLDTLLGSVVVDQVTNTRHDSDKELVGQGLGNTVSGMFGGLPGAGATMRTLLNIRSGGRTGLAGVVHSTLLTGILLGLGTYAALIPLPVLAGILVTVGFGIIDYQGLRLLRKSPVADRVVLLVVLSLTVFVDLITAVQMGFLVATLLFFKNLARREITSSGSLAPMVVPEPPASVELANRIQVIQAEGPIVFGTSEAFVEAFEESGPDVRAIILRMPRVPLVDQTGAYALQEFVNRMAQRGTIVVLSGLLEESSKVLRDLGVVPGAIPEDALFATVAEAVEGLNAKLKTAPEERLVPRPYLPKIGG